MKRLVKLLAVIMLGMAVVSPAYAATQTGNLNVNATVVASCSVSVTGINFGNYDGNSGSETTANGDVSCTCTNNAAYKIGLGAGNSLSGGSRRLTDGTNFLNYYLRKPGDVAAWGDSDVTGGTFAGATGLADSGNGAAQAHTVFGHMPAGQLSAPTGGYSDVVVVTVEY